MHTIDPPKLLYYYRKCCCKYLHKNYNERMRKREKRWERFGQHRLALRIDGEMRRGRHSFILGERKDPSWMNYKCHTSKRDRQSQGRDTFRVLVVS
jgi:hypothetical protein